MGKISFSTFCPFFVCVFIYGVVNLSVNKRWIVKGHCYIKKRRTKYVQWTVFVIFSLDFFHAQVIPNTLANSRSFMERLNSFINIPIQWKTTFQNHFENDINSLIPF